MKTFESKIGTFVGTGSAITEATIGSLGFRPAYLEIWNETDGDTMWKYFDGMTAGHAYKIVDGGAATDVSRITANGVTLSSSGFSVGTDISESGKTFRYYAIIN